MLVMCLRATDCADMVVGVVVDSDVVVGCAVDVADDVACRCVDVDYGVVGIVSVVGGVVLLLVVLLLLIFAFVLMICALSVV